MTLDNRRRFYKSAAFREPMVWLLVAIPAASVIAAVVLLTLAARSSGSDDAVADPVRRTAQIQVADLGPDARARSLKLSAVVRSGKGTVDVMPVNGEFDRAAPLTLSLRHPSHADLDRTLTLKPTKTGWRAQPDSPEDGSLDLSHDWNVQLAPADGAWRLQGRWPARQQAAYLHPAVEAGTE